MREHFQGKVCNITQQCAILFLKTGGRFFILMIKHFHTELKFKFKQTLSRLNLGGASKPGVSKLFGRKASMYIRAFKW